MFSPKPLPEELCKLTADIIGGLETDAWHVDKRPCANSGGAAPPKIIVLGLSRHATSTGLIVSPSTYRQRLLLSKLFEIVDVQIVASQRMLEI